MSLVITRPFEPRMFDKLVSWNETDIKAFPNCVIYPSVTLVNGDFEGAATPVPTGWSVYQSTTTRVAGTRTGGTGSFVGHIAYDGANAYGLIFQAILTINNTYNIQAWLRGDGTAIPQIAIDGEIVWAGTNSSDWQFADVNFTPTVGTTLYIQCANLAPGLYIEVDDIVVSCISVTQFTDLSNDGYHLIQWIPESRPTWTNTVHGGYLAFDGINDFMHHAIPDLVNPTHGFVLLGDWSYGESVILVDGYTIASSAVADVPNDGRKQANLFAGAMLPGPMWGAGEAIIIDWEFNSASSNIAKNGAAPSVGNAGNANPAGITLGGAGYPLGYYSTAAVFGLILYSRTLTTDERQHVLNYFYRKGTKMGIMFGYMPS